MSDTLDIDEIDDRSRPDFRRANGAPMIIDKDGKNQRLSRPSNYAKPLDDESALTNWRIDVGCIGVATHRDLQAQWIALDFEDRKARKDLRDRSIDKGKGTEGADTGTAIHKMTDRWETDETFDPPEPYGTQLRAYTAEMNRLGLKSVRFEQPIVNMEFRAAGTTDRIYELTRDLIAPNGDVLEAGLLVIGDTKTTRRIEYSYPSYACQMALYAGGEFYDVERDEFVETPHICQSWAIIMHIPSDSSTCEAQWVDLEAGRWGAYLAQQVKDWRRKWRSGEYSCPRVEAVPPSLAAMGEVTSIDTADDELRQWISTMVAWHRERMVAISQHPEAKKHLVYSWPADLPKPKEIDSVDDVNRWGDILSATEARFELAFVPNPIRTTGHSRSVASQLQPPSKEDES